MLPRQGERVGLAWEQEEGGGQVPPMRCSITLTFLFKNGKRGERGGEARLFFSLHFPGPPFVDPELQQLDRETALRAPAAARPPVPLLQLALRRFAQDEARVE